MDAPCPAVRFSAVIVEIRALGSHFVAIFRFEKYKNQITKTFFPQTPEDLLIGCWGYYFLMFLCSVCGSFRRELVFLPDWAYRGAHFIWRFR